MKSAPGQWGCDLLRVMVLLGGSTFVVRKRSGFYLVVRVDAAGLGVVSRAGGITLAEMVRVVGLGWALSGALTLWRKPTAVHDPARVACDLALLLALGGRLAAIGLRRAEPGCAGRWPQLRRCPARSTRWPRMRPGCWRRSTRPGRRRGRPLGGWLAGRPPTTGWTGRGRW